MLSWSLGHHTDDPELSLDICYHGVDSGHSLTMADRSGFWVDLIYSFIVTLGLIRPHKQLNCKKTIALFH